jgi:hypothetical protein
MRQQTTVTTRVEPDPLPLNACDRCDPITRSMARASNGKGDENDDPISPQDIMLIARSGDPFPGIDSRFLERGGDVRRDVRPASSELRAWIKVAAVGMQEFAKRMEPTKQ